jgi:hypothetical protein
MLLFLGQGSPGPEEPFWLFGLKRYLPESLVLLHTLGPLEILKFTRKEHTLNRLKAGHLKREDAGISIWSGSIYRGILNPRSIWPLGRAPSLGLCLVQLKSYLCEIPSPRPS